VSALAGVWRFDGKPAVDADCARMLAAQQIYGLRDIRQWSNGALAMGRRLFRTLPEDAYDRQPLQSRDGRLTLVADVRLDNRDELGGELGWTAVEARQSCDAAILLESLDRWGDGAVTRLVGDFAFALWDSRAHRFLLVRDFVGQRPLHYHCGRGFFAFASMPKGLHALAEVPHRPDEQLVAEFLVRMPRRGPRSFFADIARVEPGHIVAVTRDGISSHKYWQPRRPNGARLHRSDYVEGMRHHLDRATQSRLRGANGAVGAHLSAGLDSTAVTATAARLLGARGGKVVAFTAVPRPDYGLHLRVGCILDEGPLAAATAAMYPNVEHVLIRSGHRSPLEGLDRSVYLYDRPILNPCNNVWISAINQAARERKLNVLLIGAFGNLTASYDGLDLLRELLLAGRFIRLWRESRALVEKRTYGRRRVVIETFGAFMPPWLWRWANTRLLRLPCMDISKSMTIRSERLTQFNIAALARARRVDFSDRPWTDGFARRLWFINRFDHGDENKGMLAGWGLDWRDPFADKRLVEYCLSTPTGEYLADGVPRALARQAFSDRLPQAVVNEMREGLQAADWHEGLTAAHTDLVSELDRFAACASAAMMLDVKRMKRLAANWPGSGCFDNEQVAHTYRMGLLRGVSVGHFLRKTSGAN
jgi:asparagine synthase (glutamine-hydrolysing)